MSKITQLPRATKTKTTTTTAAAAAIKIITTTIKTTTTTTTTKNFPTLTLHMGLLVSRF
jgi:hypothetical protein